MDDVPPASADEYPIDDTTRSAEDVDGILRSPRSPERLVNDLRGAVAAPDAPIGFWRGPGTFRDRLRIFAKHERSLWSLDAHDAPKYFPGQKITRGLARVVAVLTGREPTALADRWADRVGKIMVLRGIGLKAHLAPLRAALSFDRRGVIFEGHLEEVRSRLRRVEEHLIGVYNDEMDQLQDGIENAKESVIRAENDLKNLMRNSALSAEDREAQIQNALANLAERKDGVTRAKAGIGIHKEAAAERLANAFRQIKSDTAEEFQSLMGEIDARERERIIHPPWYALNARQGRAERAELERLDLEINALRDSHLNTPEAQAALNAKLAYFYRVAKQGRIRTDMQTQLRFERLRSLHRALGDEYFDRIDNRFLPELSMQAEGTFSAKYEEKDGTMTYEFLRDRLPDTIGEDPEIAARGAMKRDGDVINKQMSILQSLGEPKEKIDDKYLAKVLVGLEDGDEDPDAVEKTRRALFDDAMRTIASKPEILKAAVSNAGEREPEDDDDPDTRRATMYRDAIQRIAYNLSILPEFLSRCWPDHKTSIRPVYDRAIPPMIIAAAALKLYKSGDMEKEILKRRRYDRSLERQKVKFSDPPGLRPAAFAKLKGKKIDAVMVAFNASFAEVNKDIPAGTSPPGPWLIAPNIAMQNAITALDAGQVAAHNASKPLERNRALDLVGEASSRMDALIERLRTGVEAGGTTRGVFDPTEDEFTSYRTQLDTIEKNIGFIPRLTATP